MVENVYPRETRSGKYPPDKKYAWFNPVTGYYYRYCSSKKAWVATAGDMVFDTIIDNNITNTYDAYDRAMTIV